MIDGYRHICEPAYIGMCMYESPILIHQHKFNSSFLPHTAIWNIYSLRLEKLGYHYLEFICFCVQPYHPSQVFSEFLTYLYIKHFHLELFEHYHYHFHFQPCPEILRSVSFQSMCLIKFSFHNFLSFTFMCFSLHLCPYRIIFHFTTSVFISP